MHVLFLRPVPGNERFGLGPFFRIEPLGMEYIAAALESRGHQSTIADLRFSRSLEHHLTTTRPGLVGIAGMHALETDEVLALARRVRQLVPGVPLILGGHTAAAYPEPFLSADVDAVILDDGERVVPEIVDALQAGRPLKPSLEAASRPKKMSKSRAMGRHASSTSALRATRSTRLCTRIHFLRIPRRRSSIASARLRDG